MAGIVRYQACADVRRQGTRSDREGMLALRVGADGGQQGKEDVVNHPAAEILEMRLLLTASRILHEQDRV